MTKTINVLERRSRWICRCASWGITSYDLDPTSGRIIFPAGGSLFFCADPATGHTGRNQIRDWLNHSQSGISLSLLFFIVSLMFACSGPLFPYEIKTKTCGARLNATMCPHNPDLIAFVNNGDIWVTSGWLFSWPKQNKNRIIAAKKSHKVWISWSPPGDSPCK